MPATTSLLKLVIQAKDEASRTLKQIGTEMKSLSTNNQQLASTARATGLALTGAGLAIAGGLALATREFASQELAFTGIRKTVDATEEEFKDLEKRLKSMSNTIPVAFQELARIGELAGQLGVRGVDNIEKFSRTIADIAVSTNLTAEQAATDFARIANIMNEPIENVDRMGSTIVELGNNFATTEAEIDTFAMRIAGAGNIVGLATSDIFAIGAAMSSVGIQAEAGGTAVSTAMLEIHKAILSGSEDLSTYAAVTGKTAEEFEKAWKEDAGKAFADFVIGLGNAGDDAILILEKLGLADRRMVRAFLSLAGAGDLVTRAIESANEAWEDNIALTEEAEKFYNTMAKRVEQLWINIKNLSAEFGEQLAPAVDFITRAMSFLVKWFSGLSDETKKLIVILASVSAAILLIVGVILTVIGVIGGFIAAIGAAGISLATVGVIIAGVVAAIAGLTVVIFVATKIWKEHKETVIRLWKAMKESWDETVGVIIRGVRKAVESLTDLESKVLDVASVLFPFLGTLRKRMNDVNSLTDETRMSTEQLYSVYNAPPVMRMSMITDEVEKLDSGIKATTASTIDWGAESEEAGKEAEEAFEKAVDAIRGVREEMKKVLQDQIGATKTFEEGVVDIVAKAEIEKIELEDERFEAMAKGEIEETKRLNNEISERENILSEYATLQLGLDQQIQSRREFLAKSTLGQLVQNFERESILRQKKLIELKAEHNKIIEFIGVETAIAVEAELLKTRTFREQLNVKNAAFDNWISQQLGKASGYVNSMNTLFSQIRIPFFGGLAMPIGHEGGLVQQTGPHFLQRGEMIIPRRDVNGGVGGPTVIIQGGTFMSEEAAEEMGDLIIAKLQSNVRV